MPPRGETSAWVRALARRAHAAGRMLVRPGAGPPPGPDACVLHRHLVFVVWDAPDRALAGAWLRAAARASPRGHLVLVCRTLRPCVVASRGANDRTCARHDEARVARLIADGRFEQADAWLAALRAEATLRSLRPARHVVCQLAWLRFWQGRFEEGWRCVADAPDSSDVAVLRAWLAWARGDGPTLAAIAQHESGRLGGPSGALLAACLNAAWRRDARQVCSLARRSRRPSGGVEPSWPLRLAVAEAAWTVGLRDEAQASLASIVAAPALPELVRSRLQTRILGTHSEEVDVRIRQMGAHGLDRWAQGSAGTHVLHALPALLEILNDSEDEAAALASACRWTQQACGAHAVMFLAGDGRTLAAEGWRSSGLRDDERRAIRDTASETLLERPEGCVAAHPIRYGGARVGAVAILASPERQESAREAAYALACVTASAVRGRLTTLATSASGDALAAEILGQSAAIAAVRDAIARAAVTPFPVLIEGESGTGKELVARALHRLSARRDRRLMALNCAALSDDLAEAELFGHSRGAFTGAVAPRAGLFEEAHGGTLFLDEVGELSPRAQAKLLRALQEREVRRVGENASRAVDVRVIAATNRSLADMAAAGTFREDLLFRLAVVRVRLPPLRDRSEDVPALAHVFWRRLVREAGKRAVLGADAVARLVCHRWPGNVRELQNVMAGLVVLAPTRGRVGARHVEQVFAHAAPRPLESPTSLDLARAQVERRVVAAALARHGGRRVAAARELGLTRQGLAKAVRRLHLAGAESTEGVA